MFGDLLQSKGCQYKLRRFRISKVEEEHGKVLRDKGYFCENSNLETSCIILYEDEMSLSKT